MQVAAATNLTLVNYAIGGATSGYACMPPRPPACLVSHRAPLAQNLHNLAREHGEALPRAHPLLLTGSWRLPCRLSGSLVSSTNQAIQALLNKATSTPPCSTAHGCYNMTFTGATIPSLLDQVRNAGACRASRQAEAFSSLPVALLDEGTCASVGQLLLALALLCMSTTCFCHPL
jgi:hypothetical protein